MKLYINHIIGLASIILFNGCVGIGIVHQHERDEEYYVGKTVNEIEKIFQERKLVDKYTENNKLIYEYEIEDVAYRGIVPMIIIGIPLIIPVGSNETNIEFENGVCTKAVEGYTNWSGYMCGLLNENGKMGCAPLGKRK